MDIMNKGERVTVVYLTGELLLHESSIFYFNKGIIVHFLLYTFCYTFSLVGEFIELQDPGYSWL